MRIKGVKEAVKTYHNVNKGGIFDPWYGYLMFDYSDGEVWTDEFYSLGHNEWKEYRSKTIIRLDQAMREQLYSITEENVYEFIRNNFKGFDETPRKKKTNDKSLGSISIDQLKELAAECGKYVKYGDSLNDCIAYEFDNEFFDYFFHNNPMGAAKAASFGKLNWEDEYIRFNKTEKLESVPKKKYEKELLENSDRIIARAIDLYKNNHISLSNNLVILFDEYLKKEPIVI